jgi:D-3-phosphoglycerate dehydrogenase
MQYEPPTLSAYGDTLLSHPRVIMTPHVGASTAENQERSGMAAVEIVVALLNGDSANVPKALV